MTARAAAKRYARALFDVALREGADLDALQRTLSGFAQLFTTNQVLWRALTNPAIPAAKKRAIVDQLISRSGGVPPMLAKLLLVLAERDRLVLVPDLAAAYERQLMDHHQIVRAEVVTPIVLPPDRIAALKDGLARATGRTVQLDTSVDPSILGGAIARIGSIIYDGSVTRQLERMKESLLGHQS